MKVDLAIIGAGPAGYAAALRAVSLGRKPVIFEKEHVGGVCLNRGCIPTKAAFEVARWAKYAHHLGVNLPPAHELWGIIREKVEGAVKTNVRGLEGILRKRGVQVIQKEASFSGENEIRAGGEKYTFKNALVCTGSLPAHPSFAKAKTIGEEEWLFTDKLPEKAVVVGGGVAGLEMAFVLSAVGVEVHILEMAEHLLPFADPDIGRTVERELKKQKVKPETSFRVKEIREINGSFEVENENGDVIEADLVFVATGRKPASDGLNLERAGVELTESGFVKVDSKLRTTNPSIYAAGDVTGPPFLAHRAYAQAETAVEHMCGGGHEGRRFIPYAVFTEPEIAGAGAFEKDVESASSVKIPVRALGKAHATGHTGGEVKIVYEKTSGLIRGIHLISHCASEIISSLIPALEKGLKIDELANATLIHPTFSEILLEAALSAVGKPFHYG